MDSTITTKVFRVSGREEDVNTVSKLLRHIEFLGIVGASRNILVRVDGDGDGRIRVRDEDGFPIDKAKYNIKQDLGMGATVAVYDIG